MKLVRISRAMARRLSAEIFSDNPSPFGRQTRLDTALENAGFRPGLFVPDGLAWRSRSAMTRELQGLHVEAIEEPNNV